MKTFDFGVLCKNRVRGKEIQKQKSSFDLVFLISGFFSQEMVSDEESNLARKERPLDPTWLELGV
jgi:hypothetical protein